MADFIGQKNDDVTPPVDCKPKRKQPNHFFAVRIANQQIVETVETVQKSILQRQPLLKSALITTASLHVTLALVHLADEQDLLKANKVLQESAKDLTSPINLHLAEVGHFRNKVVFARIQQHDDGLFHLNNLSKSLCDGCQTAGITLIDADKFIPHVTLLKLSKDPKLYRRKGIKSIGPHLYENHMQCVFGQQVIESVQLLSMIEPKDDQGYYALKGEFHLNKSVEKRGNFPAGRSTPAGNDDLVKL